MELVAVIIIMLLGCLSLAYSLSTGELPTVTPRFSRADTPVAYWCSLAGVTMVTLLGAFYILHFFVG